MITINKTADGYEIIIGEGSKTLVKKESTFKDVAENISLYENEYAEIFKEERTV